MELKIAGVSKTYPNGVQALKDVVLAPQVNPYLIGGAIALILLAVAATATRVPARRAALVNPSRTPTAE